MKINLGKRQGRMFVRYKGMAIMGAIFTFMGIQSVSLDI